MLHSPCKLVLDAVPLRLHKKARLFYLRITFFLVEDGHEGVGFCRFLDLNDEVIYQRTLVAN